MPIPPLHVAHCIMDHHGLWSVHSHPAHAQCMTSTNNVHAKDLALTPILHINAGVYGWPPAPCNRVTWITCTQAGLWQLPGCCQSSLKQEVATGRSCFCSRQWWSLQSPILLCCQVWEQVRPRFSQKCCATQQEALKGRSFGAPPWAVTDCLQ